MKNRRNPFLRSSLTVLVAALASTSHAATLYWDGNGTLSNNWTNTATLYAQADGSDPALAAGANDDVVFVYSDLDDTMYLSQTTGTISVKSLTFNNTGISQIRAGGASRTLNIGLGGITVNSGAGAVLLGRANGTTGAVTQTFKLAADQSWTNHDVDTLDFYYGGPTGGSAALGSAIDTNGKILSLAGAGNFSLDTPISGAGSLIKGGGGTATIGNAHGATGANTYAGATTINEGTLIVQGGNAIPDAGAVALADALDTILQLNASETIGSLSGGGTTGGTVNLQANTLTVGDANTNTTYSGILSGTGGLAKQGTGTLALSGPNTYEGATTVSAGNLVFQNTAAKPSAQRRLRLRQCHPRPRRRHRPRLLHRHRDRRTVRQHPRRRQHGPRLQCRHRHHGGRLHLRLQPRRRCQRPHQARRQHPHSHRHQCLCRPHFHQLGHPANQRRKSPWRCHAANQHHHPRRGDLALHRKHLRSRGEPLHRPHRSGHHSSRCRSTDRQRKCHRRKQPHQVRSGHLDSIRLKQLLGRNGHHQRNA